MSVQIMGWDIGGAHLKAVGLDAAGRIAFARQEACPLWRGLDQLDAALDRILAALPGPRPSCHAVTMTGELADHFPNRSAGVLALTERMQHRFAGVPVWLFAGVHRLLPAEQLSEADTLRVASANWLASGLWVAQRHPAALFIDVGSTTADLLPIANHTPQHRGYTDSERMRHDELVYTGVARTPAMTVAERVPLGGHWAPAMAEVFATTADIYRLTGELPEPGDQFPAADQGAKTAAGSRQRLARQFGHDAEDFDDRDWAALALYLRERQLMRLREAVEVQLSRGLIGPHAPLVGAGIGRFLIETLALRLQRPYVDFGTCFDAVPDATDFVAADCGPAAAVARLALQQSTGCTP